MTEEKSKIEQIINQINSKNCKKVALFLVISFACYHAVLHLKYGKYFCIKKGLSNLPVNFRYKLL